MIRNLNNIAFKNSFVICNIWTPCNSRRFNLVVGLISRVIVDFLIKNTRFEVEEIGNYELIRDSINIMQRLEEFLPYLQYSRSTQLESLLHLRLELIFEELITSRCLEVGWLFLNSRP